jgi:putative DNA primase/helicase
VYGFSNGKKAQDANDGGPASGEFVCAWLEVTAQSRNESGEEWGYVLKWKDPDQREHTWSAPQSLIVKSGTELVEALARGGLKIAPGKRFELPNYISNVNPTSRILNVPRTGWYTTKQSRVFVLPKQVIGIHEGEEGVILQGESYDPTVQGAAGTLPDWRDNVAALCVENEILMFATSVGFAAPTLELLGKDSGGLHLHGLSSTGKSTALAVAASVWGYRVETWRTTDNALEDTAERHNDVLLALDEFSQVDSRKAAEVAYMLGNGEGKQRLTQTSVPQRKKRWRLLFLSTGEVTLQDHAEAGGTRTKAGTEVRMVNIDADAGRGMGIFRNIHGSSAPSAFADLLKDRGNKFRGIAGPAFVERLINHEGEAIRRLGDMIDEFTASVVPAGSSGEIYRVAERFAVVGAAGELATDVGITGWTPGAAFAAAKWCFARWLENRSTGASDLDKAIGQIRAFLIANESRFEDMEKRDGRSVYERVGFRRANGGDTEYLVPSDAFREILCKGYDAKKVAEELDRRGHLRKTEKDRLQIQQRVPGVAKPMRVYAIQSSILTDGEVEAEEPVPAERVL